VKRAEDVARGGGYGEEEEGCAEGAEGGGRGGGGGGGGVNGCGEVGEVCMEGSVEVGFLCCVSVGTHEEIAGSDHSLHPSKTG